MYIGIVLAAGKGKRFGATEFSKTTVPLLGKPIVAYGVDILKRICGDVIVVTGVFALSVEKIVEPMGAIVARDLTPMGTGGSFTVGVRKILEMDVQPDVVVVGYGDHMMFYHDETIKKLISEIEHGAAVSMVAAVHEDPDHLAWGRVVRDKTGHVVRIVEQKDATERERKILELNAGLYAFDWDFAKMAIQKLKPSAATGEYYLTDLIGIAIKSGQKVAAVAVPFEEVGYGINTPQELAEAEKLYSQRRS